MRSEEIEISGHNLTLSWMLDSLEIKSITSYRDYESDQQGLDLDDGSWLKFRDDVASTATIFHTEGTKEQDQFSQEFQFIGTTFSDKMDYVVGLYYFEEDGKEINPWEFTFYNPDNDVNVLFNGTRGGWYEITGETQAIYGQANYNFNEKWRLSLGARYTWDEKELTLLEEDPGLDQEYKSKEDWSEPTGMINLTYFFTDEINMYGKIAEGYAAGIYNPGTIFRNGYSPADPTPALTPADPEETTAYEIGLKSRFWDSRLQFNAAVFYNDNENLQTTDFVDGVRTTINSGESDTTGFEVDLVALLAEEWTLFANYGYSDTDYSDKSRRPTPFRTGMAAVQWDRAVDYGLWTARLDATYMGETRYSLSDPRVASEPRTLINARLSLAEMSGLGGNIRVALWGKNLADEEYIEHGAHYGSYAGYTWGLPRTYGVDLAYEF
jgi:iron complex outermembrane receptor protein